MKKQQNYSDKNDTDQVEVIIVKKSNGIFSQQIKLKLLTQTNFGSIVKFMHENGLLKSKNAVVRPAQRDRHVIGHSRKIQQCIGLIKLKFIVQEADDKKGLPREKVQALRSNDGIDSHSHQKTSICGRDGCNIM